MNEKQNLQHTENIDPMQLVNVLKGHRVYIQTHNCPDPDAISCAFGLQALLKHFGIEATACYDGPIDRITAIRMLDIFEIEMHAYQELAPYMTDDDYIVLVDSQKMNKNITNLIGDEVACIDHHPVFYSSEYHYKDIRMVGACASMIAQYYQILNIEPDVKVASALTYGIKMDTADLSRGVTKLDTEMICFLYEYTDWQMVRLMYSNNLEFEDLRAYGAAIHSIEVYQKMGFAFIPFDCPTPLIAIISDFILALDVVEIAVVYALRSDSIRFSVRSENPEVNAGILMRDAVAGIGDGGGHPSMAGGYIEQSFYEAHPNNIHHLIRKRFLNVFEKMHTEQGKN